MGVMKQMWADNFTKNTPVTAQLMQKLPDGTWVPYVQPRPIFSQEYQITTAVACRHEWNQVVGIYKVYVNCKHCGVGKETLNAENS